MITFVVFTVIVYVTGFVMGDRLGIPTRPHKSKPAKTTIPLANVVHMADWKWLEQPTMKRRQRIEVIDVD